MSSRIWIAASLLTLALGSGCASLNPMYVTQRVDVDTEPALAFEAIKRFAMEQGWLLTTVSPGAGHVEALTPKRLLGSVEVRDRWTFRVRADGIDVTKELEAHFDANEWSRTPYVCDGYEYREERETLNTILSYLNRPAPVLTARR